MAYKVAELIKGKLDAANWLSENVYSGHGKQVVEEEVHYSFMKLWTKTDYFKWAKRKTTGSK